MDFGKYDDYSHDNNPFAGSNHYYSNGILNASDNEQTHEDTGRATPVLVDDINSSSHMDFSRSGLLGGSGIFGDDFFADAGGDKNTNTPPHLSMRQQATAQNDSPIKVHSKSSVPQISKTRHETGDISGENTPEGDDEHDEQEESDEFEFSRISTSEQPTLYVDTDYQGTDSANAEGDTGQSDLSFHASNSKMKVTGSTKNFMTVYYEIEYFGSIVHRRYSDFVSFRTFLLKFFQTKVIPPIPEKHSISRVMTNPFNYKQDSEIIDRRIRLLEYFLDRLYRDPEIRKSIIFNKFLDSSVKKWSDALSNPPFTTLASRSLLLTSPKDPSIPNPYLSYLPVPPLSHLGKYNSKLNSTVFEPTEIKLKQLANQLKKIEATTKRLIHNFEKNRLCMVELGGFFNIFSILEEQQSYRLVQDGNRPQNGYIEKFGDKVDWTFLKIQNLVTELTIRIKEPLIILRQTIHAMIQLLAYRKLKELQMSYLQEIILRKQVRLKTIIERLASEMKLNEILSKSTVDSPTVNNALDKFKKKRFKHTGSDYLAESSIIIINNNDNLLNQESDLMGDNSFESNGDSFDTSSLTSSSTNMNANSTWKKAIAGSSSASPRKKTPSAGKDISKFTTAELSAELNMLNQELNTKLIPCFNNLLGDVKYLSINVEKNVNTYMVMVMKSLNFIMCEWKSNVFEEFLESCAKIWSQEEEGASAPL